MRRLRDNLGSADAKARGTGRRLLLFDPGFDDTLMGKLESLRI